MEFKKGKYQVFVIGDEKIVSDSRDKIKDYAKEKGVSKVEYKMSVDNLDDIGDDYKKI